MDQRYTIETLVHTLGPTQLQAMLWRLDHMKSSGTTVSDEFNFVTDGNFATATVDHQATFLRKLRDDFIQHLGNVRSTQAIVKQSIQSTSVAES